MEINSWTVAHLGVTATIQNKFRDRARKRENDLVNLGTETVNLGNAIFHQDGWRKEGCHQMSGCTSGTRLASSTV